MFKAGSVLTVLVIAEEYPPNVQGGLGVHYMELVKELACECKVIVMCARSDFKTPAHEESGNTEIIRIWAPDIFPFKHIFYMLGTIFKGYSIKKDITHICAPFGLAYVCLPKREPIVVKMHTVYDGLKGSFIYTHLLFPFGGLVDRFLIRRADIVLTISEYMGQQLRKRYNIAPEKLVVTLNGIDTTVFHPANNKASVKKQLGLQKFQNVVLFVGRITERKGPLKLAEAINPIIKKYPDTGFVFIGSGFTEGSVYEKSFNEQISRKSVRDNVVHIQWTDRDKLPSYYQSGDIYCHPAEFEPFGNVVAEALASGLAMIVSASGGPEEIVGDAGIIMEDNKSSVIAADIIKLLGNKKLMQSYQEKSMLRAKRQSWRLTAHQTVQQYKKLIGAAVE